MYICNIVTDQPLNQREVCISQCDVICTYVYVHTYLIFVEEGLERVHVLTGGLASHLKCCSLKEGHEFDGIPLLNIMCAPHLGVVIDEANCLCCAT